MLIRVGGIIGVVLFVLWLYAVFDSITAPAERVRLLPKALWVLVVLLLSLLGATLWFAFGRPLAVYPAGGVQSAPPTGMRPRGGLRYDAPPSRRSKPVRGIAPDDDVAFLRSLEEQFQKDIKPEDKNDHKNDETEGKD